MRVSWAWRLCTEGPTYAVVYTVPRTPDFNLTARLERPNPHTGMAKRRRALPLPYSISLQGYWSRRPVFLPSNSLNRATDDDSLPPQATMLRTL